MVTKITWARVNVLNKIFTQYNVGTHFDRATINIESFKLITMKYAIGTSCKTAVWASFKCLESLFSCYVPFETSKNLLKLFFVN